MTFEINNHSVGATITAIREGMGMTKKDFAESMQIDPQTQHHYESGKPMPLPYLQKVSSFTGAPIRAIVGEPFRFRTYGEVIDCIHALDDIGVLRLGNMLAEGRESEILDRTIEEYVRALDRDMATTSHTIRESICTARIPYDQIPVKEEGLGIESSAISQCPYIRETYTDVLFGYIADIPIIIMEVCKDNKEFYCVILPKEHGGEDFEPALFLEKSKLGKRNIQDIVPEMLRAKLPSFRELLGN